MIQEHLSLPAGFFLSSNPWGSSWPLGRPAAGFPAGKPSLVYYTITLSLWAPLKDWADTSSWDWRSRYRHLRSWRERLLPLNAHHRMSWSKSRKMRPPMPNLGFEPWCVGSTTKKLTIWHLLSGKLYAAPALTRAHTHISSVYSSLKHHITLFYLWVII